jgi:hypothetical protein
MPRIVPPALLALVVAAMSGCGGGSSKQASTTTAANGAPVPKTVYGSVPAPVGTTNTSPGTPATPPASKNTPRSVYGSFPVPSAEAGAKRGSNPTTAAPAASATFVVRDGRLTPARRTVPAAQPFVVTLVSGDGKRHVATLRARSGYALEATGATPGTVNVPALRPGTYALTSGRSRARLRVSGGG